MDLGKQVAFKLRALLSGMLIHGNGTVRREMWAKSDFFPKTKNKA